MVSFRNKSKNTKNKTQNAFPKQVPLDGYDERRLIDMVEDVGISGWKLRRIRDVGGDVVSAVEEEAQEFSKKRKHKEAAEIYIALAEVTRDPKYFALAIKNYVLAKSYCKIKMISTRAKELEIFDEVAEQTTVLAEGFSDKEEYGKAGETYWVLAEAVEEKDEKIEYFASAFKNYALSGRYYNIEAVMLDAKELNISGDVLEELKQYIPEIEAKAEEFSNKGEFKEAAHIYRALAEIVEEKNKKVRYLTLAIKNYALVGNYGKVESVLTRAKRLGIPRDSILKKFKQYIPEIEAGTEELTREEGCWKAANVYGALAKVTHSLGHFILAIENHALAGKYEKTKYALLELKNSGIPTELFLKEFEQHIPKIQAKAEEFSKNRNYWMAAHIYRGLAEIVEEKNKKVGYLALAIKNYAFAGGYDEMKSVLTKAEELEVFDDIEKQAVTFAEKFNKGGKYWGAAEIYEALAEATHDPKHFALAVANHALAGRYVEVDDVVLTKAEELGTLKETVLKEFEQYIPELEAKAKELSKKEEYEEAANIYRTLTEVTHDPKHFTLAIKNYALDGCHGEVRNVLAKAEELGISRESVLEQFKQYIPEIEAKAEEFIKKGEHREAEYIYIALAEVVEEKDKKVEYFALAIKNYALAGSYYEIEKVLARAKELEIYYEVTEQTVALAEEFSKKERYKDAAKIYMTLAEVTRNLEYLVLEAENYALAGDYKKAAKIYKELAEIYKELAEIVEEKDEKIKYSALEAENYALAGDYKEAAKIYKALFEMTHDWKYFAKAMRNYILLEDQGSIEQLIAQNRRKILNMSRRDRACIMWNIASAQQEP